MELNKLPDNLIIRIFGFFEFSEISKLSEVCQKWRRISRDQDLKRRIDVRNCPLTGLKLRKFVSNQCDNYLVELRLRGAGGASGRPNQHISQYCLSILRKQCPNIKKLVLEDMYFQKTSHREINLSGYPPTLTHLEFISCTFQRACKIIVPDLVCFQMVNCIFFTCKMAPTKDKSYLLEAANITKCDFSVNLPHILGVLNFDCGLFGLLKRLNLENSYCGDDDLMQVILHCGRLEELFVGYNPITDVAVAKMNRKRLPRLARLCIVRTKVSWDCMLELGFNMAGLFIDTGPQFSKSHTPANEYQTHSVNHQFRCIC